MECLKEILGRTNVPTSNLSEDDDFEDPPTESTHNILRDIQVSTVDAFQGAEKDVILLACSRTTGLGFSDSPNRLNVALTRSKRFHCS